MENVTFSAREIETLISVLYMGIVTFSARVLSRRQSVYCIAHGESRSLHVMFLRRQSVYSTVHEKCHVVCIWQQFIILGPITRTVSDSIISSFKYTSLICPVGIYTSV